MSTQVDDIVRAARSLPLHEQLEVVRVLAQSLAEALSPLASGSATFWTSRSLDELARDQQTPVVSDVESLKMADWPLDEAADDLADYVRHQRDADRGV